MGSIQFFSTNPIFRNTQNYLLSEWPECIEQYNAYCWISCFLVCSIDCVFECLLKERNLSITMKRIEILNSIGSVAVFEVFNNDSDSPEENAEDE